MSKKYRTVVSDWYIKRLEDIAKVERGKFTARPRNDPKYYGGEIPFIQTGDVTSSKGKISSYSQTLNKEGLKVSKLFPKGSILITIAANIGDVAITLIDVACPDSIVVVQSHKDIYQKWLFYVLSSYKKEMESAATQNAQKNINLQVLRPLQILTPPLEEQKKIVEILESCDRQIELTEKLISAKRKLKQGLMQKLLTGKVRFPEFEGTKWKVKKLLNIASFTNGKAHENDISDDGKYIVINSKFISTEGKIKKHSHKCLCPVFEDEIVMVMSDVPNGQAIAKCFYIDSNNKYTLNQRICSLKILKEYPKFIFYLLNRNSYFLKFDDGVKQTNLRKSEVLGCSLTIPSSLEEQKKIAATLTNLDKEIYNLTKYRQVCKKQKKALMQQLLTGKTRVKIE